MEEFIKYSGEPLMTLYIRIDKSIPLGEYYYTETLSIAKPPSGSPGRLVLQETSRILKDVWESYKDKEGYEFSNKKEFYDVAEIVHKIYYASGYVWDRPNKTFKVKN